MKNLTFDIINRSFDVDKILEFVDFDQHELMGFDTETTNKAMPVLFDYYSLDPNERVTEKLIIEKVRGDKVRKGGLPVNEDPLPFWNGLLIEQGEPPETILNVPQIRKAYKKLNNATNPHNCYVSCLQFGTWDKKTNHYKVVVIQNNEQTFNNIVALLKRLKEKNLVMHNGRFDVAHVLKTFGVFLDGLILDTQIAAILAKGKRNWPSVSLKNMCKYLMLAPDESKKEDNPLEIMWDRTHNFEFLEYAIQDVVAVLALWQKLKPIIKAEGVMGALLNEYKIIGKLCLPEINGICIDQEALIEQIENYGRLSDRYLDHLGEGFPPVTQNAAVLSWLQNKFPDHKITSIEKKAFRSNKNFQADNELTHVAETIFALKSNETQKSHLRKLAQKGVFYPSFTSVPKRETEFGKSSSGGTVTGRMTAGIHITPKERRKVYVPKEGHSFLCADYNAIQFWITAEYCQDPTMYELIKKGIDPHTYLASKIYSLPDMEKKGKSDLTELESSYRQNAKMGNFGFIFGLWHTSFQKKVYAETRGQVDLTEQQALEIREGFFNTFAKVGPWQEQMFIEGVLNGYCETAAGRKRYWSLEECIRVRELKRKKGWYVPELKPVSINGTVYRDNDIMHRYTDWDWKNICINTPVQGTEAEILKTAVHLVPDWLEQKIWHHDSIVVEVPNERIEEGVNVLNDCMVQAGRRYCPTTKIEVEIEVANCWR